MKIARLLVLSLCSLVLPLGAIHAQVFVRVAPPPPVYERPVPPPGPRYVWVPGYQRWDGHRYLWVGGRYVLPPRPHAVWIAGHWDPRPGGYLWIPGHWR